MTAKYEVQSNMTGWHIVSVITGFNARNDCINNANAYQRDGRFNERFRVVEANEREVVYEAFSPRQLLAQGWRGEAISQ